MNNTPTTRTSDEQLNRAFSSLKNVDIQLSPGARRRLALECRRNMERGKFSNLGAGLRSFLLFQLPRRATAAALGLAVVAGISSLFLSERQDWDILRGARESQISLVNIQPVRQGGVLLEWRDGTQEQFWVLKSSNPRDFSKAERYSVVGTRWMDLDPGKGQVTYYRVE